MHTQEITSVGIDVGTTTTQMVLSRIYVTNTARGAAVPRMAITGKEILYQSDIYFTPLLTRELIDAKKVKEIIDKEYRRAGISKDRVDSGAVIITGETARKRNAKRILDELSTHSGNFVVAAAGPLLESLIAGKGSGAAALSSKLHRVVVNIDVGGGTSNVAVFKDGGVIDSTCINVGGRLIELEPEENRINYLAPAGKKVLQYCGLDWVEGDRISVGQLNKIVRVMAKAIVSLLQAGSLQELSRELLMSPPLRLDYPIDAVTFSGGVSDYLYAEERTFSGNLLFKHGDIGPLLGLALRNAISELNLELRKPKETMRATVIGTGIHTLNLSGSTIMISPGMLLPLRNVPVVKPVLKDITDKPEIMVARLAEQLFPYRLGGFKEPVAIALKLGEVDFIRIQEVASAIVTATKYYIDSGYPLIIIVEDDCGKVLGQSLKRILNGNKKILCLDQLNVGNGDYIDIGKPIMDDTVVPVVIKTLVFNG